MEKLSSILPSSARVKSVDLTDAQPRRPGAPAFGAPVGRNTVQDRVTLSKAQAALAAEGAAPEAIKDMPNYSPKDFRTSKLADVRANEFFNTRVKPVETGTAPTEASIENFEETTRESVNAKPASERQANPPLPETFE